VYTSPPRGRGTSPPRGRGVSHILYTKPERKGILSSVKERLTLLRKGRKKEITTQRQKAITTQRWLPQSPVGSLLGSSRESYYCFPRLYPNIRKYTLVVNYSHILVHKPDRKVRLIIKYGEFHAEHSYLSKGRKHRTTKANSRHLFYVSDIDFFKSHLHKK
jgi:hypothetical protein